jgi:hypothetical protein
MLDAFLLERDLVLWAVVAPFLIGWCWQQLRAPRGGLPPTHRRKVAVAVLVGIVVVTCWGLAGGFAF